MWKVQYATVSHARRRRDRFIPEITKNYPIILTNSSRQLDSVLIATWFCSQSILINPDKTKLLLWRTPQMLNQVTHDFSYPPRKEIDPCTIRQKFRNQI